MLDSTTTTLESIITKEKQKFIYLYSFDDQWDHDIVVEKILRPDPKAVCPVCIDGALNCPPEECGGIDAFYETLKAANDKNHPDYEEYMNWIEEGYDPEHFDLDEINEVLADIDKYIVDWDV